MLGPVFHLQPPVYCHIHLFPLHFNSLMFPLLPTLNPALLLHPRHHDLFVLHAPQQHIRMLIHRHITVLTPPLWTWNQLYSRLLSSIVVVADCTSNLIDSLNTSVQSVTRTLLSSPKHISGLPLPQHLISTHSCGSLVPPANYRVTRLVESHLQSVESRVVSNEPRSFTPTPTLTSYGYKSA